MKIYDRIVLSTRSFGDFGADGQINGLENTSSITLNQNTPGISLTLSTSASPDESQLLLIQNAGSQSVSVNGTSIAPGANCVFVKSDASWGSASGDPSGQAQTKTIWSVFSFGSDASVVAAGASSSLRSVNAWTITGVRASVATPGTSAVEIDVKKNGVSILSGNLTIDVGDNSSVGSASPTSIVGGSVAVNDDDKITVEIVSNLDAAGIRVSVTGEI